MYENVSYVIKIDEECYQLQGQYKRANNTEGGEVAKVAIKGNTKANGRYSERILTASKTLVKI
jgi:hypothetical protein